MAVIGLLHPGEMGAQIGATLVESGHAVLWASEGRSADTAARARAAGLTDAATVPALADRAEVILSVCPPHAAVDVATALRGFRGIYIDANAVSPATAETIAGLQPDLVDGGIVGGPPVQAGTTRLYLSGPGADPAAELFAATTLEARVVSDRIGAASALKMAYAAWTKGTQAMLLAIRASARAEGVEDALLSEWAISQPDLEARSERAARAALTKGWRWVAEMEEIAETFARAGIPDGFHRSAAAIYAAGPQTGGHHGDDADEPLAQVLAALPRDVDRDAGAENG